MSQKPNVLIFGGINELTPLLALHLVPLTGEPLVSHLRIVDKYIMNPPTTYVIKNFPKLLLDRKDLVDYRQANLTVPATIAKCFTDLAPNSQPYTHIIDLTGEESYQRAAEVHISQTLGIALSIALEASKHPIKSYIRHTPSYYDHTDKKTRYKEGDKDGWKPWGVRGVWWHESVRAVGNIPNLPLVIVRGGMLYGPGHVRGDLPCGTMVSLVYKHLNEDMKFIWSPKVPKNTIHSMDWVGGIWATSLWAATKSREELNQLAGANVPPTGDKLVESTETTVKKAQGGVLVPVLNMVDETDLTQEGLAAIWGRVFGVKMGFQNAFIDLLAKLTLEIILEDINEHHMDKWTEIITTSTPPVPNTPLSPYCTLDLIMKHACGLDGSKFRNLVGYTFKYPQFNEETVKQTIESWRVEGIWPNNSKYPPS